MEEKKRDQRQQKKKKNVASTLSLDEEKGSLAVNRHAQEITRVAAAPPRVEK